MWHNYAQSIRKKKRGKKAIGIPPLLSDGLTETERHTDHLEVLTYNTLRVRTQENIQIQDSSKSYPGECGGRLQCYLYRDIQVRTI